MLPRYLALFVRNGGALDQARAVAATAMRAQALERRIDTAPLILLAEPAAAFLPLGSNGGAAIGTLFDRHAQDAHIDMFDMAEQTAITASQGRHLFDRYWGGYVAFLDGGLSRPGRVLRDPSGAMPCYYVERDGLVAVSGDVEMLIAAGMLVPRLDWTAIGRYLLAPQLRPARTALTGVRELLRGTRLDITSERVSVATLWSPWTFAARAGQCGDLDAAVEAVKAAALGCIGAWGRTSRHGLLGLSGGLDSSIVAAGLAHAGTPFTALSIATRAAAGDEREPAQRVADHLGAGFVSAFFDPAKVDLLRSDASHLPWPLSRPLIQEVDRISEEVADAIGTDMHFNGGGGDNVFCYLGSAAPLADRLLSQGPGRGAMATARAIGAITGASLWTVARLAARKLPSHARAYRWHMDETLMPSGVAAILGLPAHPWLDAPRDAMPGKAAHIAALLRIENHVEGLGRGQRRGICAPLLSQPLVETCLAIPSWYWCEGGINRAIARKAFADRLPAPILDRQIKGTPDSFSANLFEANRALLAEILLSGRLAAQGLIDRQAVTDVLRWAGPVKGLAHLRILTFATVEAWIAVWESRAAPMP